MRPDVPQRQHDLHEVFNALRWIAASVFETMVHDLRVLVLWLQDRADAPMTAIFDNRTLQSSPERGARAGYDGAKRRKGSKGHIAVDTLGHLLALHVTPADPDRLSPLRWLLQIGGGGSIRIGHWRLYAERDLAGERAVVCFHGETLTLEYEN